MTQRSADIHPNVNARWDRNFPRADFSRFVAEAMLAACREKEREETEARWATTRARAEGVS